MAMTRILGLGWVLGVSAVVVACSGSTGPAGADGAAGKTGANGTAGTNGTNGTDGTPSISAITPPYAFLDRTVNLEIAGSGTAWDSAATVGFADPNITVKNVTVASKTGLLVTVNVAAGAKVGPVNVSVTDKTSTVLYTGAFTVEAPETVTATPTGGVPQGGLANLHVVMNDLTTPYDPDTINVTVSSPDLETSQPSPTDYAYDLTIQADVLATPGTFDLTTTCGSGSSTVTSPAAGAVQITARTPTALTATATAGGMIATELDTELYKFQPASAAQEFLQFTVSSQEGQLAGTVIPKDGKYADALVSGFGVRYGQGITSTDPFYVVVGDSNGLFGAGPTPADSSLVAFESPCTSVNEIAETSAANNDTSATAQALAALPALVNGTLGYGSVDGSADQDTYAITLASAGSIHAATGGDPYDDTVIEILDGTGSIVATSDDLDYQEDIVYAATAGTYYVAVVASTSGSFDDSDATYQLFIGLE